MKKFLFIVISLVCGLQLAGSVSALTDGEGGGGSCVTFQSDKLRFTTTDKVSFGEVSKLQDFLIYKGLLSGSPTGFYGFSTVKAVKLYQASKNVPQVGRVSALTKSLIKEETCGTSSVATPVCAYEGPVFGGSPQCTAAIEGQNYGSRCTCSPSASAGANSTRQITVSNSVSGPWTTTVQNNGTIYVSATGLNKSNNPKACMALVNTSGCSSVSSYRELNTTSDTWLDNSTLRISVQSGTFPNGTYEGFVLYPGSAAVSFGRFTLTGGIELKVSVSNSPSGPWVQNGAVVNSGKIYTKTTGLVKSRMPQGCVSPTNSTSCLAAAAHRPFTETEWGGTTDTVTTIVDGGIFPNGTYDAYVQYSGEAPIKVGTFKINPKQSRYEWGCTTFGGTVTPPPASACTASTVNETRNVSGGSCYCSEITSP
jgi:peptidoglycan hydrolase-like protein with peptidoglycan-binding domain